MEILEHLLSGFQHLAGWLPLLIILIGVIVGILAGAMPGLAPSTAVALLVPFSYTLSPTIAIILLVSIYISANYGGSITAVLINTPGTPAAAVTTLDGYPLAQKGQAGKALGMALIASTIGGIIGVIILILFTAPLAKLAIQFNASDYFALALFGLATVASMSSENVLKALIAILFGLLIKTVGIDPISGVTRFTFGFDYIYDGFNLIPALIGLFALSTVFAKIEEGQLSEKSVQGISNKFPTFGEIWKTKLTVLRSSIIGTIIGVFPGAGATIASFISYDIAKRSSKTPEAFGKGCLDGVAAAEGANSSSVGGALVPLLSLGIPGSATSAVLLGAFILHDLNPGPLLFQEKPDVVYSIFASLIIANVIMLFLGYFGNRFFIKCVSIPQKILFPLIAVLSVIGSFSINNSLFDVGTCIGFGIIGWLFKRYKYPVPPIVLGIVLGKMVEENFRRAVLMEGYTAFISNKLSFIMIILAILSFAIPIYSQHKKNKTGKVQ